MRNFIFLAVFFAGACASSPSPLEIKVEMLQTKLDIIEGRLNALESSQYNVLKEPNKK